MVARAIYYGIDTADDLRFSCFMSGSRSQIDTVYSKMNKILLRYNQKGAFHWKKYPTKLRKKIASPLFIICEESKLWFNIFEHPRKRGMSWKDFYLKVVVTETARVIENNLRNKYIRALFIFDNDFHIKNIPDGTERFMKAFLRNLANRLSGEIVYVRGTKRLIAEFKHKGKLLEYKALETSRDVSKEIQISDIALGLFRYLPKNRTKKIFRYCKI